MTEQEQKCQACGTTPLDTDEQGWGLCQPCHTMRINSEADIAEGRVREVSADEFVTDQQPAPIGGARTTTPEKGNSMDKYIMVQEVEAEPMTRNEWLRRTAHLCSDPMPSDKHDISGYFYVRNGREGWVPKAEFEKWAAKKELVTPDSWNDEPKEYEINSRIVGWAQHGVPKEYQCASPEGES